MNRALRWALSSLALLGAAPGVLAQEVTPTHTYETPMVFDPFTGSIVFATMIGPPAGESIWKTELHLEWTTDGTQSAALFGMHLGTGALEHGDPGDWELTGADLGWDATPGRHSAVVSTDLFNDTLLGGPFGGPTFDLILEQAGGGGLWGTLGAGSKIVFHLGARVDADVSAVSLGAGGTQTLALKAGPTVGPGMTYLVLGSLTGTSPGFSIDGFAIPLVPDAYTLITLNGANQVPFLDTFGDLGPVGTATAEIAVPAGSPPGLAGLTLHHALIGLELAGPTVVAASNAVDLLLQP